MDPVTAVGLVASILQLIAAAKSVIDLGRDARNATKDQRDLFLEIQNLAPLLEDVYNRLKQSNNRSVNGIQQLGKPLDQLKETMEHITRKLGSANKVGSKALVWTFWSKKEVDEDLAKIERFKAVLNAWLLLDNWDVGQQQEKHYNQIRQDQYQIRTELGNISQNQREYHEEIAKSLTSSSNTQRQDNYWILTEVRNVAQDQHQFLNLAERDKIIEWLSPLNFFARHDDIFRTRQEGTGRWFLEDSRFKNWLLSTGESIWCLGIPGAGKTVLTSIVVDYLRNNFQGNNTGVAAVYLNHKESEAQSPSDILASLWWQLASERLISPLVQQLYQKHQNRRTRPSLDEVRKIFHSIVAEYSRVFVVVDALDEYPEAHRHILLDALAVMGGSVSLMLTSRPNIAPEAFFPTALVLEISAKDEDIRCYVKAQIQNSFRLSKHVRVRPELHKEIETKIAKNADGMFLLAKLHIDSLATKSTVKAVREALQSLPEDLEHTYDEAMERIEAQNKDDREIARRTLIWVAYAKRPLTLFQLQEALAINPDSKALDADSLLDMEIILSVCAGLVIVKASQWFGLDPQYSIVRLVHLTIQEYLDRAQHTRFPGAQTEITRQCLTYVSFNNVPDKAYYWQQGLLSYAAHYCLLHAAGKPELQLQDIIIQFLGNAHQWRRRHHLHIAPLQWRYEDWPSAPSNLWVAVLFGLQHIARLLLENDKSTSREVLLRVALKWNSVDVIRVLINQHTNDNAQQPFIRDVLQGASHTGQVKTVQLLLDNGADVDAQGGYYGTALQAASVQGHVAVVQLLLKHSVDIDALGKDGSTALQVASAQGHLEIAQLLLEHGANINAQGGKSGTALQAASMVRRMEVVQLLLKHGADVNTQGGHYGTALQAGSAEGHLEIVRLLLKHGANVNMQRGNDGTALHAASANGYLEIVQFLLEHGADVNTQGGYYGTALKAASAEGKKRIVQLLLKHGADPNLQGGRYGTALQVASAEGKSGVVQLLLKHGVDVNAQGGHYGTALQAASQAQHIIFLEYNAYDYRMQAASPKVVQLLLENGADVNLQGGHYGTALQAASAEGNTAVVQVLLENGADVNLQGGDYGTALQAASSIGCMKVVQLLLENGANVNTRGGKYGTAYHAAKSNGHTEVAELLITYSADTSLGSDSDSDGDMDVDGS
ncbi:ankyrin repeat-containing domain protein [Mycena rebaudengoi]|nr:ankyrin repeat-containing domain protein [Mycena rebaudengoi]